MNAYEKLTDEQLITKLRNGDVAVIDYLMDKYKDFVRKKVRVMYLLGGENDDLIQEGMIGLFKAVQDYDEDKGMSFYSFANLCVTRQLSTAIEASQRKKHMPLNSYVSLYGSGASEEENSGALIDTIEDGNGENPEEIILNREAAEDFRAELYSVLSSFEEKVLYLHLIGTGYVKIAELLNKSPKAVDNALQRIRGKARRIMDQR
jgi:RNA polymerase sporulation-specific sigma factor